MKHIFVSGATGFVGKQLVLRLAKAGHRVHAVYRNPEKCSGLDRPGIELYRAGGLSDIEGLESAMKGCEDAYHLAAFAAVWLKNPDQIYRQNVEGTRNILKLARQHHVKKLVFTSTAGVLGPSDGHPVTEGKPIPARHFTHYDRSKAEAEELALRYNTDGLEVVVVNPTRIYGPGNLSQANTVTLMIRDYLRGRWKWIPGNGESIGNYVYIDDVVEGHLLAMEKGIPGERYLMGGSNHSFNEFFRILADISGKRYRLIRIPLPVMMSVSGIFLAWAKLTGLSPPITPSFVRRYNHHWIISSDKAMKALGYQPRSLEAGIGNTLEWIRKLETGNEQYVHNGKG